MKTYKGYAYIKEEGCTYYNVYEMTYNKVLNKVIPNYGCPIAFCKTVKECKDTINELLNM